MTTVATEARLEVENTVGAAVAIDSVSQASPGAVSKTAHGLAAGDVVKLTVTSGMTELDGQVCRVANVAADTFELEGLNTTNYAAWEAGGGSYQVVNDWLTVSSATDVDVSDASPTELDGSKLIHRTSVTKYGRKGAKSGSVGMHDEPFVAANQKLKDASTADLLAFRITLNDGSSKLFGANTSYSGGFNMQNNAIITGQFSISVPAEIVPYAT